MGGIDGEDLKIRQLGVPMAAVLVFARLLAVTQIYHSYSHFAGH